MQERTRTGHPQAALVDAAEAAREKGASEMTGAEMIEQGNILIAKGHEKVSQGIAMILQEVAEKTAKPSVPLKAYEAPNEMDWMPKRDFCKRLGISGQTADNWVRAGKVEKIHDSSRKVRYRMLERAS